MQVDAKVKTDISADHEELQEFQIKWYWRMA